MRHIRTMLITLGWCAVVGGYAIMLGWWMPSPEWTAIHSLIALAVGCFAWAGWRS